MEAFLREWTRGIVRSADDAGVSGAGGTGSTDSAAEAVAGATDGAEGAVGASDDDAAILADISTQAAAGDVAAEETVDDTADGTSEDTAVPDTEPDPAVDPAGFARYWQHQKELIEAAKAEAASAAAADEAGGAGSDAPANGAAGESGTVEAPSTIRGLWEQQKAAIEQTWAENDALDIDTPGEKALVAFIEPLVEKLEQMEQRFEAMERQEMHAAQVAFLDESKSAISQLKETYGIDVPIDDFVGAMDKGALAAHAAVLGVPVESFAGKLNADLLKAAFETYRWRELQGKKVEAERKVPPSLNRGGGSREREEDLSDEELIARDLAFQNARKP
jgi:hypothetical protein